MLKCADESPNSRSGLLSVQPTRAPVVDLGCRQPHAIVSESALPVQSQSSSCVLGPRGPNEVIADRRLETVLARYFDTMEKYMKSKMDRFRDQEALAERVVALEAQVGVPPRRSQPSPRRKMDAVSSRNAEVVLAQAVTVTQSLHPSESEIEEAMKSVVPPIDGGEEEVRIVRTVARRKRYDGVRQICKLVEEDVLARQQAPGSSFSRKCSPDQIAAELTAQMEDFFAQVPIEVVKTFVVDSVSQTRMTTREPMKRAQFRDYMGHYGLAYAEDA